MNLYTNNTISAIGNYRIFTLAAAYENVSAITAVDITITGGTAGAGISSKFRYGTDGHTWSLWTDVSTITDLAFDPTALLYLEFKFTGITEGSPALDPGADILPEFVIGSLSITPTYVGSSDNPYANYTPMTRCSDQFCSMPIVKNQCFTFDPYAVNSALCLYKELSEMTNQMFGHEVIYYRVRPQARSIDVVLKEWTIFSVEQHKCLKILVPNNEFPDSKPKYNNFGIDFEIPFEIHIDKGYWDKHFGIGSMPQQFDVIFFPMLNKIYEIQSTYVYRDFMQLPLYFKAQLVKYQPKSSIQFPENIAAELDSIALTTEKLFGDEIEKEVKRVTKPEQYITITHLQDPTRATVHRGLPVDKYELYNHWTLMADTFYDMATLYATSGAIDAVTYRINAELGISDNRSFLAWFSPQQGSTTAQARALIDGLSDTSPTVGMSIDLMYSTALSGSSVRIKHNGSTYLAALTGVTLADNKWYGLVVNISNQFSQLGIHLWERTEGSVDMTMLHSSVIAFTPGAFDSARVWKLIASPIYLTNIRMFNGLLEEEKQNLVLSQYTVADSDEAILIDNAKTQLRLPRITNPR